MEQSRISRIAGGLLLSLCVLLTTGAVAQTTKEEKKKAEQAQRDTLRAQLKLIVDARQYMFFAQTATAVDGNVYQLGGIYSLKIRQDSMDIDLPYFGTVHATTVNNGNGGIRFKTTSFSYTVKTAKKGGWSIVIVPKDNRNAGKLNLDIDADGYGNLEVISNYRETISFRGQLLPVNSRL